MNLRSIKNLVIRGIYKTRKKTEVFGKLDYEKCSLFVYGGIRWISCSNEPVTVKWIESFGKDDVIYDIGANIGAYSLIMSKYAKEVYAFEPAVFNFSILTKNIIYNHTKKLIENNITPLNLALSSQKSVNKFNYSDMSDGSSCHVFGRKIDYEGKNFIPVYSQNILSLSVDDLIDEFGFPIPNHIKIDVDGNEFDILKGAKKTLKNEKVESLLVEINEDLEEGEKSIKLIEKCGFVLKQKSKTNLKKGDDWKMFNHIFYKNK